MRKFLPVLFISVIFLLGACTGAEQVPTSEAPESDAGSQPAETTLQEDEPEGADPDEIEPKEKASADPGDGVPAAGLQMECTLVSDQPDVPAEFAEIFGVKDSDWVKGPETAAVTFVEYGDFQ